MSKIFILLLVVTLCYRLEAGISEPDDGNEQKDLSESAVVAAKNSSINNGNGGSGSVKKVVFKCRNTRNNDASQSGTHNGREGNPRSAVASKCGRKRKHNGIRSSKSVVFISSRRRRGKCGSRSAGRVVFKCRGRKRHCGSKSAGVVSKCTKKKRNRAAGSSKFRTFRSSRRCRKHGSTLIRSRSESWTSRTGKGGSESSNSSSFNSSTGSRSVSSQSRSWSSRKGKDGSGSSSSAVFSESSSSTSDGGSKSPENKESEVHDQSGAQPIMVQQVGNPSFGPRVQSMRRNFWYW